MSIRIALAGNPNSGKTTLFNALTGSNQFVGNWPGVTVEKKEGKFFLVKGASDTPVKVGDVVKEGDVLCYVEAMKTYNAVRAEFGGTVTAICLASGDAVSEDDVLMTIQ